MATDRLALAHVLEDAGIQREGAEKVASAIFDAIHDNVAAKADIAGVRADLAAVRAELKADIAEVRADLATVRAGLKADIAEVRADLATVRAELKADIAALEHRIPLRGTSALVVAVGIILAALRYLGNG
jgi:hypothetical protein